MKKGDRLQYSCGHWLMAGESGIQDDYAQEITRKTCGECWRQLREVAPQLLSTLKQICDESRDPNIERLAQEAIKLTVVNRDPVE